MQELCVISAAHGNRKRRTVNAALDVRPATANLWLHREQRRRARRRRSPHRPERLSREVAGLDWARTCPILSARMLSPQCKAGFAAGLFSSLPDEMIDLKQ